MPFVYGFYTNNQLDQCRPEPHFSDMEPLLLLGLGLGAGVLTTLAGLGGGLLLLLCLSALWGPAAALAATSPALLAGNLHRSLLYRRSIDWRLAKSFVLGAFPGALAGGLVAASVPAVVLTSLMAGTTLVSLGRTLGLLRFDVPVCAVAPAGVAIGGLTGSSGGAGVLTAPLFLSSGLTGEAYVGTGAVAGVAMHFGRMCGYGAGGLFSRETAGAALILAVAVLAGNVLGTRARKLTRRLPEGLLEHAVLVICVALALLGLGRA